MSNDIYFRTSIAGYNKNDVMRFIEKLNNDQVERVNDLNDQLRTSHTEVKKLSAELEILHKRCDELENSLSVRGKGDIANAEKALKYDEMQKNYADIMLEAENSAKDKMKSADLYFEEKQKLLREAKTELMNKNKEIIKSTLTDIEGVLNSLTLSLEKAMTDSELNDNE